MNQDELERDPFAQIDDEPRLGIGPPRYASAEHHNQDSVAQANHWGELLWM
jgi:hypothetical protein